MLPSVASRTRMLPVCSPRAARSYWYARQVSAVKWDANTVPPICFITWGQGAEELIADETPRFGSSVRGAHRLGSLVLAAESPIGQRKTIDDKTRSCPTWSSTDHTAAVAIALVTGGTFR